MKQTLIEKEWVSFIDSEQLRKQILTKEVESKLASLLSLSWCEFFDSERKFVKKASVGIVWIWWIPFSINENKQLIFCDRVIPSIKDLRENLYKTISVWWYYSYLNSWNQNLHDMRSILKKYKHYSTLHTIVLNIQIAWISTSVENEFNSQKDLFHFCRITEARTKTQNNPSYVVLYPELLNHFQKIQLEIEKVRSQIEVTNTNILEWANLMHSSSKATWLLMTGSLRNFQKFVKLLEDNWKEEEMKRVVYQINDTLQNFFPDFFDRSDSYWYKLPQHISNLEDE